MRAHWMMLAVALAALSCFEPSKASADAILLLGSGDLTNESMIQSILQAQGNTVTIGPTFNNFTGAGLSSYNAVMLMPNGAFSTANNAFLEGDMPVSGQQALVNFVNAGGGLVTSEYLMEKYAVQGDFQTLYPAIPVVPSNISTANTPITFTGMTSNPALNAGLPSTFTVPIASNNGSTTEAFYTPKQGATAFFSTNQWTSTFGGYGPAYGVIGWNYGLGRVISFSTALDSTSLANLNVDQLVSNAVNWAVGASSSGVINPPVSGGNPPAGGPNPPPGQVPEPATVFAWSVGLVLIVGGTRMSPACTTLILCDVAHRSAPRPFALRVPASGLEAQNLSRSGAERESPAGCIDNATELERLGRLAHVVFERELPPGDIVPSAALVADGAIDAHRSESHGRMQADAARVGQGCAGERGRVPLESQNRE